MKNKNIISLTIFAVVLVAAGMLGLSKFFENAWQRESTVDNNLNAEIINNSKSVLSTKKKIKDSMKLLVNGFGSL